MRSFSPEQRAEQLRLLASVEIAEHKEITGFLGAALDGSLATGAVWPTSDLDFTIVPHLDTTDENWVEWGERDGIVWHKHLNHPKVLLNLQARYPDSFWDTGRDAGLLEDTWLLDGLVIMEIVEDPQGLLHDIQKFVKERRFSAEVWAGRRERLLKRLHLLRDQAEAHLAKGETEEAWQQFCGGHGFGAVAAHVWLEATHRIYSSKEQDGLLAQVTAAAGQRETHRLYHDVLGVQADRVAGCAPQLLQIGQKVADLIHHLDAIPELAEHRSMFRIYVAWITHLSGTLALAPQRGHPAYTYQQWESLRYWSLQRPRNLLQKYQAAGASNLECVEPQLANLELLAEQIQTQMFGPTSLTKRVQNSLIAAEVLLRLTEQNLL
jgi:hypothetical protein